MTENDYKYDNLEIRTRMVLKIPIRNYKENKLLLARHPPTQQILETGTTRFPRGLNHIEFISFRVDVEQGEVLLNAQMKVKLVLLLTTEV
jgi:hypothetical protein